MKAKTAETAQNTRKLEIGKKVVVEIEIADSDSERALGYSGHAPISFNEGKLFIFEKSGRYTYWMKDMLFDLDIIYIQDNQIMEIKEHVPAPQQNDGKIAVIYPSIPFNKVLEVKSGFVKKFKIKVGDQIILK
jgi:hypothetical protein